MICTTYMSKYDIGTENANLQLRASFCLPIFRLIKAKEIPIGRLLVLCLNDNWWGRAFLLRAIYL